MHHEFYSFFYFFRARLYIAHLNVLVYKVNKLFPTLTNQSTNSNKLV